jgi:hypothetical protein
MITRSIWRPAMYGGFAGVALGLLSMIAGWTSPRPGLCALQFASFLGCGIGGGLVVAYGPAHTLAWIFGVIFGANRDDATWKDLARRVAILSAVTGLSVALLAAAWRPASRLPILMLAWMIVLFLLLAAGPRASDTRGIRWCLACCDALAAVYGPFLVAALNTWLFDGYNTWLRGDAWKALLVSPGGLIGELTAGAIWHRRPGLSPAILLVFYGLLSALVVVITAWPVAKAPWMRWVWLPLVGSLAVFGALLLDAIVRA